MLDVVRNNRQSKLSGGDTNEDIKVTYNNTFAGEGMLYLCIVTSPIAKGQHGESVLNLLWLLQVLLNGLAVKSTISEFCNADLRSEDLLYGCFCNMLFHTTTMAKILNPCVRIKNKAFHTLLIIKVYDTVGRTFIITMLHHLIVFLAFFCFRPTSCQTEKTGFTLFCRWLSSFLLRHDQLVSQPFTIALRK